MDDFSKLTVPKLQEYLRDRGVTVHGYNKPELIRIAHAVSNLRLPEDPDFHKDNLKETIAERLKLGTADDVIKVSASIANNSPTATEKNHLLTLLKSAGTCVTDPFVLDGYSADLGDMPDLGLYDVFNYLLCFRADYDRRKVKAYKSFEDYRLFSDGHVESLLLTRCPDKNVGDSDIVFFKARVKPTQRDKTNQKKDTYDLWICVEVATCEVKAAYCVCPGGTDGACRHIAATLYEIEAIDEQKSPADGPSQWSKRPRAHDSPCPASVLKVAQSRYGITPPISKGTVHCDQFDPRADGDRGSTTEDEVVEFAQKLQAVNPEACVLPFLLDADNKENQDPTGAATCLKFSFLKKLEAFKHQNSLTTVREFLEILQLTVDQQTQRYSHGFQLQTCVFTTKTLTMDGGDPPCLVKCILGESTAPEDNPALTWGKRKESAARRAYFMVEKKRHRGLKIEETGLLISTEQPFIGCSVDGVVTCRCKGHGKRLMEIKCPYALRDLHPKLAAEKRDCVLENDIWSLKTTSPYYFQIQGQLGLYELSHCDLVIYTKKGLHVVPVEFDADFFQEMTEHLATFYMNIFLPHVLEIV